MATVTTTLASSTTRPTATTEPPSTTAASGNFEPDRFAVPFTVSAPEGWRMLEYPFSYVEFTDGVGRTLIVTTLGPPSVQAWLDDLASRSGAITTEPLDISVGGMSGISVDVEVSPENTSNSCGAPCVVLFELPADSGGRIQAVLRGIRNRLLLFDVQGETVAIIADAPIATFDDWWGDVENVLQDMVWLGP